MKTYTVVNLEEARDFLSNVEEKPILTNHASSVKYYGMLVIDYMFKTLSKEFPEKVLDLTVDIGDDHVALFTAIKLGYKNIVYTGNSGEARRLLCGVEKHSMSYRDLTTVSKKKLKGTESRDQVAG
ncbi:hypothetical protein [Rickettsia endosymbiont of Cantharis rufa]|uniref:hypothetical protein n=1 Tax=Rickettsia endosymbiont of Cantharis rufa TaxID=3066248 RepID=UPI0031331FF9